MRESEVDDELADKGSVRGGVAAFEVGNAVVVPDYGLSGVLAGSGRRGEWRQCTMPSLVKRVSISSTSAPISMEYAKE